MGEPGEPGRARADRCAGGIVQREALEFARGAYCRTDGRREGTAFAGGSTHEIAKDSQMDARLRSQGATPGEGIRTFTKPAGVGFAQSGGAFGASGESA